MRIAKLDLAAFGCFTNRQLIFDAISPDFHLVYGDNEAGKTTALAAVRALLYGIHPQTDYNFMHSYENLRIGACLCARDGDTCEIMRRKGRKNTLLDREGKPLDDGVLQSMLAAMEQEQFERVFGLTHEDLVTGGKEIVSGEGDVGEALFAAGLGGVRLNRLRRSLQERAENIFKPRASKPTLNEKLGQIQDLDARIRNLQLSGNQWEQQERKLERARQELRALTEKCEAFERQLRKLQRLKRTIPLLARLRDLKQQVAELGDVVALPDDFDERRRDAEQQLSEADRRLMELERKLEQTTREAGEIEIPEDLLQRQDEIEDLYERLGAYQKGEHDVVGLRTKRDQQTARMEDLAARLPGKPDVQTAVESIPDVATRSAVEELATSKGSLDEKLRTASEEFNTTSEQVKTLETNLSAAPEGRDTSSLQRAVTAVSRSGDIEDRLERCEDDLTKAERAAERQLAQLPLWDGDLQETLTLAVPLTCTVNEFAQRFRDLDDCRKRLDENTTDLDKEESAIRQELRKIELTGTVPLEADVITAREVRDDGWQLIKQRFLLGEDVDLAEYAPDGDPGAVYEGQVQAADETVDRLRNASETVHRRAQLEAELEKLPSWRGEVEKHTAECDEHEQQLADEWRAQWADAKIDPRSPEEMRQWLDDLNKVRDGANRVAELRADRDTLQTEVTDARARLRTEIAALGEDVDEEPASVAGLLARADDVVKGEQNAQSAREQLVRDLKKARSEMQKRARAMEQAESALEDWTAQWVEATRVLDLGDNPTVNQARKVLGIFDELHGVHREAQELDRRIKGIERDARQFAAEVSQLVDDTAPDLAEIGPADAMRQLQVRLTAASKDGARLERLREEIEGYEEDIKRERERWEEARDNLAALSELAECDVDELRDAWERHRRCEELQGQIAQIREQLGQEGECRPLAELEAEANDQDLDLVNAQLQTSAEEAQTLNEKRNQQQKIVWELERQFEAMDGRDEAAACAEQRQRVVAEVRDATEQYLTLMVARQLLTEAIEAFRAENEEPMLERAGDLFARMTDGSFSGLDLEYRDADRPVLVGLKGDCDTSVTVDGMSDGTCDQLYLALRLAHIERLREHSEPLPLILDDILIRFDDNRARNTLEILGEVAQHNQVIFFTHHRRLQQLAELALGAGEYQVHEL